MIKEIINLGGYGQFVWPAFVFTFFSCFILFLRTQKEFRKQEKMYMNEFKQPHTIKVKTAKVIEAKKEILSGI